MKQRPSFQFYTQDFLGSLDVQTMTIEQIGCYCLLLFNCYNNGGIIPGNVEELKVLCRGNAPALKVLKKFYADGEFLRHERVDEELKKQEKYTDSMRKNASKRWNKQKKDGMPRQCHGINSASNRQCSSSSSSSSFNKENIKRKKIVDGENDRGKDSTFDSFLDFCKEKKIIPDISLSRYLLLRAEYKQKVQWWFEVRGCINWLFDKEYKAINAQRLRNRMEFAIKRGKDQEIKLKQNYQDKKFSPKPTAKPPKEDMEEFPELILVPDEEILSDQIY